MLLKTKNAPKNNNNNNKETYVRKEYDFNYHLNKCNSELQQLLEELNEEILNISDQIEVRYPQYYIAYRTTRNFAEVMINKSDLIVYFLNAGCEDPENKAEKVPESYRWALDRRIHIKNKNDLKYAINFIVESYKSTL